MRVIFELAPTPNYHTAPTWAGDIPAENSSGRSPLTDEKMPCLLRFDWSRPIIAESGRGKDWVDPKINDPKQGDLEIKLISMGLFYFSMGS
ncbi:hypothetical protein TNCV_454441 [Trichonephila clavipes]|nr:hypothetical protein TNCV_454441 [Trichonephila clavipes]